LSDVEKQSRTNNATILLAIGGAFHLYLSYTMFQPLVIIPDSFQITIGTVMALFGLLTLCVSLIVWLQKPWVTNLIAIVGVAACAAAVIFGYFLMIIILAPIYWFAIKWIRTSNTTEIPDWAPDWNED
jgi:hypothetical protein